jgi:uncharacterized protein YbcI
MGEPAPSESVSDAKTISRGMVHLMRQVAGRGPESARTTIGRDHVLVMMRETLSKGERNLVEADKTELVYSLRASYQELLRPHAVKLIEETLHRKVVGFMSANHFEPDLAAEVFVLDPRNENGHPVQEDEHRA